MDVQGKYVEAMRLNDMLACLAVIELHPCDLRHLSIWDIIYRVMSCSCYSNVFFLAEIQIAFEISINVILAGLHVLENKA